MPNVITAGSVCRDRTPISFVRVAILSGTDNGNHYSIFLIHHPYRDSSTRCHVMNQPGRRQAVLEWSDNDYILAYSTIKYWDIALYRGITVSDVGNMVYDYGRDCYEMNNARGCRWWAWVILQDMVVKGWLSPCAINPLYPKFCRFYDRNGRVTSQLPMVQGSFYPPPCTDCCAHCCR